MDATRLVTLDATITQRTVTSRDEYGDDVLTDSDTSTKCWLHQTQRSENTGIENTAEQTWTVYLPPDVALDANDRITVDGVAYEVVGPPGMYTNPRTLTPSLLEATVRRVT